MPLEEENPKKKKNNADLYTGAMLSGLGLAALPAAQGGTRVERAAKKLFADTATANDPAANLAYIKEHLAGARQAGDSPIAWLNTAIMGRNNPELKTHNQAFMHDGPEAALNLWQKELASINPTYNPGDPPEVSPLVTVIKKKMKEQGSSFQEALDNLHMDDVAAPHINLDSLAKGTTEERAAAHQRNIQGAGMRRNIMKMTRLHAFPYLDEAGRNNEGLHHLLRSNMEDVPRNYGPKVARILTLLGASGGAALLGHHFFKKDPQNDN